MAFAFLCAWSKELVGKIFVEGAWGMTLLFQYAHLIGTGGILDIDDL